MRLRSRESNLYARVTLTVIAGLGLTACSTNEQPSPQETAGSVAVAPTGATAELIIGDRCDDSFRNADGTCRKGGPDIREVKVCALSDDTVLILEPPEFQGEVSIGENRGQVSRPQTDEAFPSCL